MSGTKAKAQRRGTTTDSFQNFTASLGYGTNNLTSGSAYGFNPISRTHVQLELMYRGSWIVRQVIDAPAEDMTREGITIESDMPPDEIDKMHQYLNQKRVWQRLNSSIKWSRLYGGCLAMIMIKGQKPETPLRLDSIGKDQFLGLRVLDRWMVQPHLELPVNDPGDPDFGFPSIYEVMPDTKTPYMRVHHSRCLRLDGVELPYWQQISENMWGMSVLEPLFDRLLAFDSTTTGIAQLVYRSHLRTIKIEKLRELLAFGGKNGAPSGMAMVLEQIKMIRLMQSNEGLTVLDSTDEFQVDTYNFAGLSDVMIGMMQQLSGAAQIPLTRLFGQSPAGMNATGESDLRNYYDAIASQQEAHLRPFITTVLDVAHRSLFGRELPEGFNFNFSPLWQLDDEQKSKIAVDITNAVAKALEDMIITPAIALKELRQSSKITGVFSNISDEDITAAEEAPPPIMGMGMAPGAEQGQTVPGQPQVGQQPMKPKPAQEASGGEEEDHRSNLPPTTKAHVAKMYSADEMQRPDVILGSDDESSAVWVIQEEKPDGITYRYLLQFADRDAAMAAYEATAPDGKKASVKRTNVNGFRDYVLAAAPRYLNGHAA